MKTLYEVLNVDLAQEYTKERKREKAKKLILQEDLHKEVIETINGMNIPENDERHHWVTFFGKKAAADLLTLGKVQPETMLEMASLPINDFKEVVKIATTSARTLNEVTIQTEKELNTNTINNALV